MALLTVKYGVHQTMINAWKKQAIDGMSGIFSGKAEATENARDGELEKLQASLPFDASSSIMSSRPVTAAALAEEIEVSKRTVYRDVAGLIGQRVPIVGEAGLGYLIDRAYDMPPLMLTPDEIEAVVLGAQWVAGRGDAILSNAARDIIAKIASVIPERLRPFIDEPSVGAKPGAIAGEDPVDTSELRRAIREGRKLHLRYRSEAGEETTRIVWPVIPGYGEATRLIVARCELRQGFRHFRTDRVIEARVLDATNGLRKGALRRRWQLWWEDQREQRRSN